jgi:D-serine deaminase-like pyridoxal phosphate-dependent protein
VKITSLRTPCVLIDQRRLERNIERMQVAAEAGGKRLRPHAKTHKSPDLALTQIARGATGICCAKLGEAEVFADHRVPDIRVPYPINPVNADRVLSLLDRTRLSFIVDDFDVARGWSRVMSSAGRKVEVLIKIDVGFHRCGIDPEQVDAIEFITRVAELPGLELKGLLSHAGHAYGASSEQEVERIAQREAELLTTLRQQAASAGVPLEELSVGATPGYGVIPQALDDPTPDERFVIERLSEEHGTVRVSNGTTTLVPGDLVRIIPNHACVVSNLVDEAWIVSGDEVADGLRIAARGRIT